MDRKVMLRVAALIVGLGGTTFGVVLTSARHNQPAPAPAPAASPPDALLDAEVPQEANSEAASPDSAELAAVLAKAGLPTDTRPGDECSVLRPSNPAVISYEECNATPLSPCAFSLDDTCKVSSRLADGRHASISFDYEAAQFEPPRTKAALDRMLGHSAWQMVKPTHFPDGSWFQGQNAEWKTGRIKVQLMLMGGRNVKGEEYMNATLIFVDTSVPDPVEDRPG
jgi:hypothetical protein